MKLEPVVSMGKVEACFLGAPPHTKSASACCLRQKESCSSVFSYPSLLSIRASKCESHASTGGAWKHQHVTNYATKQIPAQFLTHWLCPTRQKATTGAGRNDTWRDTNHESTTDYWILSNRQPQLTPRNRTT